MIGKCLKSQNYVFRLCSVRVEKKKKKTKKKNKFFLLFQDGLKLRNLILLPVLILIWKVFSFIFVTFGK